MDDSTAFGKEPIGKLLLRLGFPSAMGFLVVILYGLADTMMVGKWVGAVAIAAITVAEPITYLLSAVGAGIGLGGSSIISRALGAQESEKARKTLGNQVILSLMTSLVLGVVGWVYQKPIIEMFGAEAEMVEESLKYYRTVLLALPFLSLNMIGYNVVIAEGKARLAMFFLIIPMLWNVGMDVVLIKYVGLGIQGAALATATSFVLQTILYVGYFGWGKTLLRVGAGHFKMDKTLSKEIVMIGGSGLANQVIVNVLMIAINYSLLRYKGELGVALFGIINRVFMIFLVPVIGVSTGFTPIVGYNFGAKLMGRVKEALVVSIKYTTIICLGVLVLVLVFANQIVPWFTSDPYLLSETPWAMRVILSLAPTLALQFITLSYFQAIGQPKNAVIIIVVKYMILLIPGIYFLPAYFDWRVIAYLFPAVDGLISILSIVLLRNSINSRISF